MPIEDQNRERLTQPSSTIERSFDELAKGLANRTISRRQVLKLFGSAIAGAALVAIPKVASGQSESDAEAKASDSTIAKVAGGGPLNPNPECAGATCTNFRQCGASPSGEVCVCFSTSEGGGYCATGSNPCDELTMCPNGQADCPEGTICIVESCCRVPVCQPLTFACTIAPPPGDIRSAETGRPTPAGL